MGRLTARSLPTLFAESVNCERGHITVRKDERKESETRTDFCFLARNKKAPKSSARGSLKLEAPTHSAGSWAARAAFAAEAFRAPD